MALLSYLHSIALDFNVNMFANVNIVMLLLILLEMLPVYHFTLANRYATFGIKFRGNRLSSLFMCRG